MIQSALGVILIWLCCLPATISTAWRLWHEKSQGQHVTKGYQDEDGKATAASLQAFSDKWLRLGIAVTSGLGLLVALALAILAMSQQLHKPAVIHFWVQVGVWIPSVIQVTVLFADRSPSRRFTQYSFIFLASALAVATQWMDSNYPHFNHSVDLLDLSLTPLAILRGLLSTLVPRRPDVYENGRMVDRQYTTSLFGRYSFAWANSIIQDAAQEKPLDTNEFAELPFGIRAETLAARFERVRGCAKLWKTLFLAHRGSIILQFTLGIVSSTLSFTPQVALYGILQSLEHGKFGSPNHFLQSILRVLLIGGLILFSSSLDIWLLWLIYARVGIPIYEQLCGVLFHTAMLGHNATHISPEILEADGDPDRDIQDTINLAAVDARRIADFAAFSYLIPASFVKFGVGCTILILLTGWESLLAGLAVLVVMTPGNIYIAKCFGRAQVNMMKFRDCKIAIVSEVLQGIRQIKFSASEGQWQRKIMEYRDQELHALWTAYFYNIGLMSTWSIGPLMLSAVVLGTYALLYRNMDASVVFTALSVLTGLETSFAVLPEIIAEGMEAKVSCDRLDAFLSRPMKAINTIPADSITFDKASVSWSTVQDTDNEFIESVPFMLKDLNIAFPMGKLSIVAGATGSGKSLLLASILGETQITAGSIYVPSHPSPEQQYCPNASLRDWIIDNATAYVAQIPWIENETVKGNILFGLPYHHTRYQQVISACALDKDIQMMPDGDRTEIGANGVNLSGGQRWRIVFARALYSRAGILIIDDIFSALDMHTGRHICNHALNGPLCRDRTTIIATHHVALVLPYADYCVYLGGGRVKCVDKIEDLKSPNREWEIVRDENANQAEAASYSGVTSGPNTTRISPANLKAKQFIQDEKFATGSVKWSVYMTYFRNGAHWSYLLVVIGLFFAFTGLTVGRSWWVNVWTTAMGGSKTLASNNSFQHITQHLMNSSRLHPPNKDNPSYYLKVYIALSALACVVSTARFYLVFACSMRASTSLFRNLTHSLLHARVQWLDAVPMGRILNRFTSDFHLIESRLGAILGTFPAKVLEVLYILVAGAIVCPWLIIFTAIILFISLNLSRRYLTCARQLKRLESIAKSPVFEQFKSSLTGLTTIRAYGKTEIYIRTMGDRMNLHARVWCNLWLINRWLGFRLGVIGSFFATVTAAVVVFVPGIKPSLAGFALGFAMQYNVAITAALQQYANIELTMNATERIVEYSEIELEDQGGIEPPAAWPMQGCLEVKNLHVGYEENLALEDVTFSIKKHERVGIVGRTGAGKSSLALALFRVLEARQGSIYIDGIDISKISLQSLRSRVAIIPQDPVLFSGTIRTNLDAFGLHDDQVLLDALQRVQFRHSDIYNDLGPDPRDSQINNRCKKMQSVLSIPVSEGGLNFSQGQRQQLCLARTMVSRPKIMVLDEPTSAVDMETDTLVQQSIREEFDNTTLLVIAHRLATVADFDRILVLDKGRVAEFGRPDELLECENGLFRGLVENSGDKVDLMRIIQNTKR